MSSETSDVPGGDISNRDAPDNGYIPGAPTNIPTNAAEADAYAKQFAASAEQVLEAMKRDVQALLDSFPADAATTLINDPERELVPAEILLATGLENMLDSERGNRFLNEDYVTFFKAAVGVDPEALAIKNKVQAVLEMLPEEDAVSLVRDPFRVLTADEIVLLAVAEEPDLTQASAGGTVLSVPIAEFLRDNVRVSDDPDDPDDIDGA